MLRRRRQGDLRLRGLARPAAGAQQGPAGHAGGDAARLRGVDRAGACIPARAGAGQLPGRRGVRASCRRRPSSARCWPWRRTSRSAAASPTTMRGHFFVPYPPDERQRGGDRQAAGVELPTQPSRRPPCTRRTRATTGTWSWPRATRPHVRQLFGTSYFAEGWALYAERMMRENGFYDDLRHVMYQLRGDPLPRGAHRGRHQPAPGRDDPRRRRSSSCWPTRP